MTFAVKRYRFGKEHKLGTIHRIEAGGQPIMDEDELARYVEPPLLEPIKVLYRKGIKTIMSSANIEGGVWLMILTDSMSETNLQIAKELGFEEDVLNGSKDMNILYTKFPKEVDGSTLTTDIEQWGMSMVEPFESQQNFTITRHQKTK